MSKRERPWDHSIDADVIASNVHPVPDRACAGISLSTWVAVVVISTALWTVAWMLAYWLVTR